MVDSLRRPSSTGTSLPNSLAASSKSSCPLSPSAAHEANGTPSKRLERNAVRDAGTEMAAESRHLCVRVWTTFLDACHHASQTALRTTSGRARYARARDTAARVPCCRPARSCAEKEAPQAAPISRRAAVIVATRTRGTRS